MATINFQKLTIVIFVFSLTKVYTAKWCLKKFEAIEDYATESYNLKAHSPRTLRVATNAVRIRNNGTKVSNLSNVTQMPQRVTLKKWQVGRVSRKHYEIINMLWRKTNIFVDDDNTSQNGQVSNTTHKMRAQKHSTTLLKIPQIYANEPFKLSKSSTSSYIEFYYMDETVENIKNPENVERNLDQPVENKNKASNENIDKFKSFSRSPFFAFHVNDPASALKRCSNNCHKKSHSAIPSKNIGKAMLKITSLLQNFVTKSFLNSSSPVKNNTLENDTVFTVKLSVPVKNITTNKSKKNIIEEKNLSKTLSHDAVSTTVYDKIIFFEVYDSDTDKPCNVTRKKTHFEDVNENAYEENDVDKYQKVLLEHVDQGIEHHNSVHQMRFAIDKDVEHATDRKVTYFKKVNETITVQNSENKTSTENLPNILKLKRENILNVDLKRNMSRLANWSEYPFAAVYIYERFQVHCDAAVISPHWLVASGSCLSRHNEKPGREGRSAFVTYCGDSWWNPERITYVKYSVVHPQYHPQDLIRRHLYNIGVIKVASSMATACTNWEPVSIMSHQFAATSEGSMASAVGWGLDRYDTKYSSTDLPRHPLTIYEGLVFSDYCPGNSGYRKSTYLKEEGIKNVYCLALPPYADEQKDPVHGGLLLVGGKLIALYLQEERRQWGDQSAQYTGVWKLVPWMLNVAREPEEADFLL